MTPLEYAVVKNRLLDRIDNLTLAAGQGFESMRQKLTSPEVIASGVYNGLLDIGRIAPADSIASLVETVDLTSEASVRPHIQQYPWPDGAWSQRDDQGLIHVILDDEPQPWDTMISFDQLSVRAYSHSFGHDRMFFVDRLGRKIYTSDGVTAQARIIKRPGPVTDSTTTLPIDTSYRDALIEVSIGYLLNHSMSGVQMPQTQQPQPDEQ